MSALSRFAEEHGGLTLNEASAAYDLVAAERERCAKIAEDWATNSERLVAECEGRDEVKFTARIIASRIRSGKP